MTVQLCSATRTESIPEVVAFDGEDASGRFSLWPRAERTVACLGFAPARFRIATGREEFVALPGAVLHFVHPTLTLATRRYVRAVSLPETLRALDEELRAQEESLRELREGLRRLDEQLLRRLWQLGRGEPR
jgi:F-type H+-transporting ATPase subunit epsilon